MFLTLPFLSGQGGVLRPLKLKIGKLIQNAINTFGKIQTYLIHLNLGCINNKNHLNPLSAFNFNSSIKNSKNKKQWQNQECI